MAATLLLALLAGVLTMLNPCVLPLLPIVLFGALEQHRLGPLALAGGLVASFTVVSLVVYGAGAALGLSSEAARTAAAVLMAAFGVVLLSGKLKQRFVAAGTAVTAPLGGLLERLAPRGLGGQFALGALLGAAWSPCTGPTLGSALALAARSESLGRAAAVMLVFGAGASLPMAALAYGSRRALQARRARFAALARVALPAMGVVLLVLALAMLTGLDRSLETVLTDAMPEWLLRLTTAY